MGHFPWPCWTWWTAWESDAQKKTGRVTLTDPLTHSHHPFPAIFQQIDKSWSFFMRLSLPVLWSQLLSAIASVPAFPLDLLLSGCDMLDLLVTVVTQDQRAHSCSKSNTSPTGTIWCLEKLWGPKQCLKMSLFLKCLWAWKVCILQRFSRWAA